MIAIATTDLIAELGNAVKAGAPERRIRILRTIRFGSVNDLVAPPNLPLYPAPGAA
jgi:hypothetical protein